MLELIKSDTVFYVVAPANAATGGPELLHQLASKLRKAGKRVYMFYTPSDHPEPVHENYRQYGIDFVRSVPDESDNLLIVPEVETKILERYQRVKKVIWWLSVDNYFRNLPGLKGKINRFFLKKMGSQKYLFFNENVKNADSHLAQSRYAMDFLKEKGINKSDYLSDYLHHSFLSEGSSLNDKKNIVAYNPKKGVNFTRKLVDAAPHIEFVAIENMSREQVVDLLRSAKVYIDFGFHPGKDRIPREAAFLGCCVIVSKRGSACYYDDVPVPSEFKFTDSTKNISRIISKIDECFFDFERNHDKFNDYRSAIKDQEIDFDRQVNRLFVGKPDNV
ncbi:hypothetical protein [Marinobacter similis]|uniref:Glycosyl transferase family 1 domain-containing protein n=1 Tax=Marinobacter similis TaxID=1420916 RepID=W5YJU4_9GAMM|nr:hypothetical protein [Marinobacter similis]AHI29134.1 hypothetical protein AU14_12615 [Marinobacter similis]